jgi:hypothetical protein
MLEIISVEAKIWPSFRAFSSFLGVGFSVRWLESDMVSG